MQKPKGPEVIVSRAKKVIVHLQSSESEFFPTPPVVVAPEVEALALHRELEVSFPQASAPIVVGRASIEPLYQGFITENFALCLERSRCFKDDEGFHTLLTFERRGKSSRRATDLHVIEQLFSSVALSVCFVPKQNTVGVFARGLARLIHSSPPVNHFHFEAGRIRALS